MTQLKHNAATRVSHYANATGGCPDRRKTGKRYDKRGAAQHRVRAQQVYGYTAMCIAGALQRERVWIKVEGSLKINRKLN